MDPPISLRSRCVDTVTSDILMYRNDLEALPPILILEIYLKLNESKRLNCLRNELQNLNKFMKLLSLHGQRHNLHMIFKSVNSSQVEWRLPFVKNSENAKYLGYGLAHAYTVKCLEAHSNPQWKASLIRSGLKLGGFLLEAGWFKESTMVLEQCLSLSLSEDNVNTDSRLQALDCLQQLLTAQVKYCMINEAHIAFMVTQNLIDQLKIAEIPIPNLAAIYSAFSALRFFEGRYKESLDWSVQALHEVKHSQNSRLIIDVLRQCSVSCVATRKFAQARLLITEAVWMARNKFGSNSVKYADTLIDFGFYLFNSDTVVQSVTVYMKALRIQKRAFGKYNLLTARLYEDAAFAIYAKEYCHRIFDRAQYYVTTSLDIMNSILPPDHFHCASAMRVKAIIMEEVAVDFPEGLAWMEAEKIFLEAQCLQMSALKVVVDLLGEMNVHTARHYGNIGRLYQSRKKCKEAEEMHLKAIAIKEKLLGKFDPEVALSLGHLATLYNCEMLQFHKAEKLYLVSIEISRKLFGDGYSGLGYDYKGLIRVYEQVGLPEKVNEYNLVLEQWERLQVQKENNGEEILAPSSRNVVDVVNDFLNLTE